MNRLISLAILATLVLPVMGQDTIDYEAPPVSYATSNPANPVEDLKEACETGRIVLKGSNSGQLLKELLEKLSIPSSSQVLSFAKHSLQSHHISPEHPRAIYFNDGVYLGHVHGEEGLLEIATFDTRLGCAFYVVKKPGGGEGKVSIERETNRCLTCHGGNRSRGVPGLMVRSVFVSPDGQPVLSAGSFRTDHTSPLKNRWGGWYVTGNSGDAMHLGNYILPGKKKPAKVDNTAGLNLEQLPARSGEYLLEPTSDIAALMVLEHETDAVNFITRLGYQYRMAGESKGGDAARAALESAVEDLVRHLLFVGEHRLAHPILGSEKFRRDFENQGLQDATGRSLRDFDLNTRMFKYPLSYMVYSRAFKGLPEEARLKVWKSVHQAVMGQGAGLELGTLSARDRESILGIVAATVRPLPGFWK